MKICCFIMLGLVLCPAIIKGQYQTIEIKVLDMVSKNPLPEVNIAILQGSNLIQTGRSDLNGSFKSILDPGKYKIDLSKTGYSFYSINNIEVVVNMENVIEMELDKCTGLCCATFFEWKQPLYNQRNICPGQFFTADHIRHIY